MLAEFVTFVRSLFPAIDPYTAQRCLDALRQHRVAPKELYASCPQGELLQGDVLAGLEFNVVTDGELQQYLGPGLLLSNTCDAENDDSVLFAACIPFTEFAVDPRLAEISRNTVYSLFYLPGTPGAGDLVADFSLVQTFDRESLTSRLRSGSSPCVSQLSQLGYYFFLSKLTVHFMRPESLDVARERGPAVP